MTNRFRCALIGTGTLPLQCGDVLLERRHEVVVLAGSADARPWAASHDVAHVALASDLERALAGRELDFVFSVVNPRVLSPALLAIARRGTINYHDSLLPAYAGVHATTWAILAGEVVHGVTWHEVAERIDAGRILKQARVPIAPDETAFTLNTKCYEAALGAFVELVTELESDSTRPVEQELGLRSYFGRNARPPAAGVIDWRQPVAQIDRLVRALQLGPYENAIGSAKLLVANGAYVCGAARVVQGADTRQPGTVVGLTTDEIHVAATDGVVALRELATLDGVPVTVGALATTGLAIGTMLPCMDAATTATLEKIDGAAVRDESFWRRRLSELRAPALALGAALDTQAPTEGNPAEGIAITLPRALADLPAGERVAFLVAAFGAFLARLGNEEPFDVALSTVRSANHAGVAASIVAQRLPLRVAPDLAAPLHENARAVRDALAVARERASYLRDLVSRMPSLRGGQVTSLPAAVVDATGTNAAVAPMAGESMALVIDDAGARLCVDVLQIDPRTAAAVCSRFETFLDDAVARPLETCGRLAVMPSVERDRMLHQWGVTPAAPDADESVLESFARIVREHPNATAVTDEDATLTFAELDRRANRLAWKLRRAGVEPEVRVGVHLERSTALVVTVLAVLKAGGAYVPIDPDYPADRIAFLLDDAAPRVVVSSSGIRDSLPATSATIMTPEIGEGDAGVEEPDALEPPASPVSDAALAYVLYTSGSTGRPKGVMISRRALANFMGWARSFVSLTPDDTVLFKTPFTFDPSGEEIFSALTTGARLVVAPHGAHNDLAYVLELMARERVTAVIFIPSALAVSATLPQFRAACASLRLVICGGEALTGPHVAALHAAAPRALVVNMYGPTEATVAATGYAVPRNREFDAVPMGRPVPGMRAYVVDRRGELVPPGVPGELWLAGVQVARGYVNRADLTAERFGTDPFDASAAAPLYRTGDVVTWSTDGELQFVGRIDEQVKVRGFRVELGEVEAVLAEHPAVRSCAVVARGTGEKTRLVAYVVPMNGDRVSATELRAFAARRLPAYMVPASVTALDTLPLTANGKLDQRALPEPRRADSDLVAPRTDLERTLHSIWSDLLGSTEIGVHDDVFIAGANSLVATRVLGRIRDQIGVSLPLRTVFDAPTIEGLAEAVTAVVINDREAARSVAWRDASSKPASIAPLSFAQELLWLDAQAHGDRPTYNIADVMTIRGALDVDALERALGDLTTWHASLRTAFTLTPTGPRQHVLPSVTVPFDIIDLRQRADIDDRRSEAQRICEAAARTPFDLTRAPLLRATLARVEDDLALLVVVQHHIVSDGWSRSIVYRDLGIAYARRAAGASREARALSFDYADFATWQRDEIASDATAASLGFWRRTLDGVPRILELPTDRVRSAEVSGAGGVVSHRWPASLRDQLRDVAHASGATMFMTLLAAFEAVLSRYSGQAAFAIGTPVGGRTIPQSEGIVGYFANMLPIPVDVAGDPTFAELLGRTRERCLAAFEHQDVPFAAIVDAVGAGSDPSRTPLFQVMFGVQNTDPAVLALEGCDVTLAECPTGTAKFDLWLTAIEDPDGLALSAEYRSDLFSPESVAAILESLRTFVEGAVRDPSANVAALPLVSAAERARLDRWNATEAALDGPCTIHELFEAAVARWPDATAIVCESDRLTYRALDARSNQLARRLMAMGVARGDLVGVCLERSVPMMVALLAILKTGAAYVPLDPTYPHDRLALMIQDSAPRVIVTQSSLAGTIPDSSASLLLLDGNAEDSATTRPEKLTIAVSAEDVAYVIYTSGSTGVPKGAVLPHRAVVNYLRWMTRAFAFGGGDRVLQKAPISFDASVWELYAPLIVGAELVLARADGHRDPLYLMGTIASQRITIVQFVPSVLAAVLETPGFATACATVRAIFLGGEALPADLVSRIRAVLPTVELHNLYGPTEAAVYATAFALPEQPILGAVPIGAPITNVQVHILDASLRHVPIGVAGELYIGGAGVGLGYLNRPTLTAERFVPDPFRSAGARMYRTGDLARWRRDGNVEFLGRIDDQVKVRGFRVELGEIERALAALPGVRECAVARSGGDGAASQLVAYVVTDDAAPSIASIRGALASVLPDYMIPSAVVALDALPLGVTGKLDRRALPAPPSGASGRDYVAPRTPLEERIASAWADVLGREQVGIRDEFFDLGGHSLLAMRIMLRLGAEIGTQLPVRLVFEHRTVEALAAAIERLTGPDIASDDASVDDLLAMLEQLSDEDAQQQLAARPAQS